MSTEAACFIQDSRNIAIFWLYRFRTCVKNLRVTSSIRIEINYLSLKTVEGKAHDKENIDRTKHSGGGKKKKNREKSEITIER